MKTPALLLLLATLALAQAQEEAKPPTLRETVDTLSDADLKEIIPLLRDHYIKSDALSDAQLSRATTQGIIERLGPGAALRPAPVGASEAGPFKTEVLEGNIGYARMGSLTTANITQLLSLIHI